MTHNRASLGSKYDQVLGNRAFEADLRYQSYSISKNCYGMSSYLRTFNTSLSFLVRLVSTLGWLGSRRMIDPDWEPGSQPRNTQVSPSLEESFKISSSPLIITH